MCTQTKYYVPYGAMWFIIDAVSSKPPVAPWGPTGISPTSGTKDRTSAVEDVEQPAQQTRIN